MLAVLSATLACLPVDISSSPPTRASIRATSAPSSHRPHRDAADDMGLLRHDQLEPGMRDNHWIVRGYRPVNRSYCKCMRTIFQGHNETVNIVRLCSASLLVPSRFAT